MIGALNRQSIDNPQFQSTIGNHNRQSAITIVNPQSQSPTRNQPNPQSSIRNHQSLRLLLLKAPPESEMEIDPLHALLGLHPDQPRSRRVQRKLTL